MTQIRTSPAFQFYEEEPHEQFIILDGLSIEKSHILLFGVRPWADLRLAWDDGTAWWDEGVLGGFVGHACGGDNVVFSLF